MSDDLHYSDDDFQEEKSPPKPATHVANGLPTPDTTVVPSTSADVDYEDDYDEPEASPLDDAFEDDPDDIEMHSNAIATPQDLYDVDEFGDSPPSVVAVEVAAHTALDESYGDNDFAESAGAELVTTPTTIGTQLALANTVEDSYNDDQDFASVVAGDDDEGQVEDIPPTSTVDRESSAASNAVEASSKLLSTHAQDNAQSTNDVIQSEVMQVIAELTNHHLESNVVVVEAANEDMSCSGVPESKKEDVQLLEPAISQVTEPADVFGVELETSSDAPESEEPRASHVLTEKEPPIEAVESASNFKPTVQEPLSTFEPPSTVDLDQVNVLTAPPPDVQPLKEALSKQTIDETMVPSTSNDSEVSVVPVVVVDATSNDSEAPAVVLPVVEQSPNDDVETTNEATGDDNAHDVETTATDVSTINSIRSECAETPLTPTEVLPLLSIDTQVVASAAATPILQTEGYPSDSTTSFRDPNITVHSDSSSSTAALSPPQGTTEQVSTTILDIEVTPKDEIVSTSFDVIGQSNENTTGETEPSFGHGLGQMNESTTGEAESSSTVIESAPTIPVKYSDAVDDVPAHEDATPVVEADSEAEFAHGAAPQQPQEFLQLVTTNALSPNAPLDSASSLPTGRSVEQNPPGPERSSSNPDTLYDYDADEVADTSAARLSIATSDETTTLSPRTNSETVEDDYMAYAQTSVFDDDAYMSGGEAPTKLSATPSGNDIYKNVDAATEVEDNTAAPLVQDTGDDLSQLLQPGTDAEPSSNTFDVPIKKQDDCKEEAPSVERTGDQGAKQVDGESSSQCIVLPLVGKKESKLKTRLPPKQAQLQPTPIPPKPRPPPQPRKPEPKAPSSDSSSPMASDFVIHSSTSPPLDASGGGMVFHSPQKDYRPWRQQEVKPQMSPPKPRVAPKKKKASPSPTATTCLSSPPKFHFDPKVDKMKEEWLLLNMFRPGDASKYESFCIVHKPVVAPATSTATHHRPSSADRNYPSHSARRLVPPKLKQEMHTLQARERNWVVNGSVQHNAIPAYDSILDKYCHTITNPLVQKQIYNSVELSPQLAYVLEKRVQATRQAELAFVMEDHTYAKTYKPKAAADTTRVPTKPTPRQPPQQPLDSDIVSLKWSTAKLKASGTN